MTMKLSYIVWDDAYSPALSGPWVSADDEALNIDDPIRIVSVGFVVRENEHQVLLAASIGQEVMESGDFRGADVSGVMCIPKGMIRSRTELAP